ncbi:MAG: protein kinase [Anaerolineae bacterium]
MNFQSLKGQTLGQYELREIVGVGGMGAVYLGWQPNLSRNVAVKVLLTHLVNEEGYIERFNREAQIAAALEHPHIIPIIDFGTQRGINYVVMRLLRGGTLGERVRQRQESASQLLSLGEIADLLRQIGSALDYAHSQGVIHRDIKPSNIMFDDQGTAFLVDFGIARPLGAANVLTAPGTSMGTVAYMAPEQWRGDELTPAIDQYAMGLVLYTLLTGRPAFEVSANTSFALMNKHLNEMPIPVHEIREDIAPEVSALVERSIAKRPTDRFPTMAEMSRTFDRAVRGSGGAPTGFFTFSLPKKPYMAMMPPSGMATPTPAMPAPEMGSEAAAKADANEDTARGMDMTNPAFAAAAQAQAYKPQPPRSTTSSSSPSPTIAQHKDPDLRTDAIYTIPKRRSNRGPLIAVAVILALIAVGSIALLLITQQNQRAAEAQATADAQTLVAALAGTQQAATVTMAFVNDVGTQAAETMLAASWTATSTPTNTPTFTFTPSATPTNTLTPSITLTPTINVPATQTAVANKTETRQAILIFGQTQTATLWTQTPSPTFTASPTPTINVVGTRLSQTRTAASWTKTPTPTNTPTDTRTPSPTNTPTFTRTPTSTRTPTPAPTRTPVPTLVGIRGGGLGIVAFTAEQSDSVADVLVYNSQGQLLENLTNTEGHYNGSPNVSPDGTQVAFQSNRDGNWEIYLINIDGSGLTNLTKDAGDDFRPTWSPDGSKILFFSTRTGKNQIRIMNPDGSNQSQIRTFDGADNLAFAWSPDAQQIVFQSNVSGWFRLYTVDLNGGEPVQITDNSDYNVYNADWSPDGTKLVYESESGGDLDIWVINIDGTGARNLSRRPGLDLSPHWSPDGKAIIFGSGRSGRLQIYTMNADGSRQAIFARTQTADGRFVISWR